MKNKMKGNFGALYAASALTLMEVVDLLFLQNLKKIKNNHVFSNFLITNNSMEDRMSGFSLSFW